MRRKTAGAVLAIVCITSALPHRAAADVLMEQWFGTAYGVDNLVADSRFPNKPSSWSQLSRFATPENFGDNYGTRVRGWLTPAVTGSYTFWIASDDQSVLFLSSDADPANKQELAAIRGQGEWTFVQQWTKYASQRSVQVQLEAGKSYYIEALHSEGAGGDHLEVAWQIPGTAGPAIIEGHYLTPAPSPLIGSILVERWFNIPWGVEYILADPRYPSNPDTRAQLSSFETQRDIGDRYGSRLRGYITAPATGDYTFWLASDNDGALYLSENTDPANKSEIAYIRGYADGSWTFPRQWDKYPTQKSTQIHLVAGESYYIEALHTEDLGGDHVAVAWQIPGATGPEVIKGEYLSPVSAPVVGGKLFATGGPISVEVLPASAGYTSELWLYSPGPPQKIATNREFNRVVSLGSYAAGTELIFGIKVTDTGYTYLLGDGSRNPDGVPHASVTNIAYGHAIVGFEDLYGGGDRDYDDNVFRFRGGITPTPEIVPIAEAGSDFSVNENGLVQLTATVSGNSAGFPVTYSWVQIGSPTVTLSGADTESASFTAPTVALGGATLTFEVTVSAEGSSSTDTVNVSIVNVNHPPVADAGRDRTVGNGSAVAEGSSVRLDGGASFDIDNDELSFSWVQTGGPSVELSGANSVGATFSAPVVGGSGAPGVVASLTFELRVDDGFPMDAPAPGYIFDNVRDTVIVEVTNVNNPPNAEAGENQTVNENSLVHLNAAGSSDPDGDSLTYTWVQVGTPGTVLSGATPSFTAPFVPVGGTAIQFDLTVKDGFGGEESDRVTINVQNINDPPLASAARPTAEVLWPPSHGMVAIGIAGVSDPNSNATITITGVTQDEPTNGLGDGDTGPDAVINNDGTVLLRAERSGDGDGRVYRVSFTASDFEGSSSGEVRVVVPKSKRTDAAVDSGVSFDSTN